jgi:hypothetical protein
MMNETRSKVTLCTVKMLIYNENMSYIKMDKVAMKPSKSDSQAEGRGFESLFPLKNSHEVAFCLKASLVEIAEPKAKQSFSRSKIATKWLFV